VNEPIEIAKCIAGMSYTGLLNVAQQLVDMNKPDTGCARDVASPHGMADTLADWAEAQVEEAEARAAELKARASAVKAA